MLPALNATWLPNHDNGGMRERIFSQVQGGRGEIFSLWGNSRVTFWHERLDKKRPGLFFPGRRAPPQAFGFIVLWFVQTQFLLELLDPCGILPDEFLVVFGIQVKGIHVKTLH